MKGFRWTSVSSICALALALAACDDETPSTGGEPDAGDVALDLSDATTQAPDISESTDPYLIVPPERLTSETSSCPAGFVDALAAGQHEGYEAGGQTRSFYLGLPAEPSDQPRPLLLAFHGTNGTGAGVFDGWPQEFIDAGFIVIAPIASATGICGQCGTLSGLQAPRPSPTPTSSSSIASSPASPPTTPSTASACTPPATPRAVS